MAIVKAQKIPKTEKKYQDDILATFCFYFPQYTYAQAKRLPFARVVKMLRMVRKEQAREHHTQLLIACAPHSKKGNGARNLLKDFSDIINS